MVETATVTGTPEVHSKWPRLTGQDDFISIINIMFQKMKENFLASVAAIERPNCCKHTDYCHFRDNHLHVPASLSPGK